MIQSVDRAVRILKALAGGPGRLGVSELSDRLGLAKGTVHGLLRTLQAHGLVEQHPDSDKYQLGPTAPPALEPLPRSERAAFPFARYSEALAGRADEAVRVGAFHGDGMLVVHHVFRPDTSLQILEVGSLLPLHATALGKAVLAYLDQEVRLDLVGLEPAKLTGQTLVTRTALGRELATVRERGYALEKEEAVLGEGGVAGADLRSALRGGRRNRRRWAHASVCSPAGVSGSSGPQ
jgi:DNA-binding IclR family transcriptional regulator